ncbi:MAG: proton-conducting transporter membrane subunit [Clostridia bacterium]|nr:proton-conducting transporter membrane subunit [Clostridia bacterium]
MALWQSIPFACILLPLGSAAVTSVLKGKGARRWTIAVLLAEVIGAAVLAVLMASYPESYPYRMGHYDAPWGNMIRVGQLEAITAFFFSLVMLLSLLGGVKKLDEHVVAGKHNLYFVVMLLLTAALMAQVYTDDMFTAYVFVEIMTIAACTLIAARNRGKSLLASTRYMIMNSIGSGLFLLGLILTYGLTGHLLMSNVHDSMRQLAMTGQYDIPVTVAFALITSGLAIKSALFPFHTWVPDAYGSTTPASASVLSSLVSKGYIFLLIKIYCRVYNLDIVAEAGVTNVLFVFAIVAMIMGSIMAIRETDIRRMIAYSSVAQIGYIFMGIGFGTEFGMMAAMFHIFAHSASKAMLFISSSALIDASNGNSSLKDLQGSGYRNKLAGIAFTVGALSMVGFPFLGGLISKINFADAALQYQGHHMMLALAALAISTWLNVLYFLRTMMSIYSKQGTEGITYAAKKNNPALVVSLVAFIALNIALGMFAQPLIAGLMRGLSLFC